MRGNTNVVLIGKTNSILVCKLIEVAMMKAVIEEKVGCKIIILE